MKKAQTTTIVVIVLLVVIVIVGIIIAVNVSNKPSNSTNAIKEKLIDNDFNIISASWENIDWSLTCSVCNGEIKSVSSHDTCLSNGYSIVTQQNEPYLMCSYILNDKQIPGYADYKQNENVHGTTENLNIKQNNQITICCTSRTKEGQICKSITLSPVC